MAAAVPVQAKRFLQSAIPARGVQIGVEIEVTVGCLTFHRTEMQDALGVAGSRSGKLRFTFKQLDLPAAFSKRESCTASRESTSYYSGSATSARQSGVLLTTIDTAQHVTLMCKARRFCHSEACSLQGVTHA